MKKSVITIFAISAIITTIGLIMDTDRVEASMGLRFLEYFAMLASIFIILSSAFFGSKFLYSKFLKG